MSPPFSERPATTLWRAASAKRSVPVPICSRTPLDVEKGGVIGTCLFQAALILHFSRSCPSQSGPTRRKGERPGACERIGPLYTTTYTARARKCQRRSFGMRHSRAGVAITNKLSRRCGGLATAAERYPPRSAAAPLSLSDGCFMRVSPVNKSSRNSTDWVHSHRPSTSRPLWLRRRCRWRRWRNLRIP